MSASGFEAAFLAALADQVGEARLERVWDFLSRRLPPLVDLGRLCFTERTLQERREGYQPACIGMMAQIEHYGRPPLRDLDAALCAARGGAK